MNVSKQTSMMAALFLSLGVGAPTLAAGAKTTGSSSGSPASPMPSDRVGVGAETTRSPENAQTHVEPTAHSEGPAALGAGTLTADPLSNSLGQGRHHNQGASQQRQSPAAERAAAGAGSHTQHQSLGQLERETVMDLQTALQTEGLYQGSIDGVAGARTKKALRQYQQARQLEASGQLDSETMRQLGISGGSDRVPVRGVDSGGSPLGARRSGALDGLSPPPANSASPGGGAAPSSVPGHRGGASDFGTGPGTGTGPGIGAGSGATAPAGGAVDRSTTGARSMDATRGSGTNRRMDTSRTPGTTSGDGLGSGTSVGSGSVGSGNGIGSGNSVGSGSSGTSPGGASAPVQP